MNGYFISFLLLIFSIRVSAQVYPAARFAAMGNTGAALQGPESLTANAAGIAGLSGPTVAIYYQTHLLDTDISSKGLFLAMPTALGVLGLQASNYGLCDLYSETKVGATYAKTLGNHLYAALTAKYHQVRIADYGEGQAYSFDVGLQYRIQQKWVVGTHVTNLGSAAYDYGIYAVIPVQLRLGTSYVLHEGLMITADVERVLYRNKTDVRTGMEYKPCRWMRLRGGLAFDEFTQFCGMGLAYRKMGLDIAAVIHPRLGVSSQILLAYAF